MRFKQKRYALIFASVLCSGMVMADEAAPEAAASAGPAATGPYVLNRSIELGGSGEHVSGNNGDWSSAFVSGVWQTDSSNVLDWVLQQDRRFDQRGTAFNGGWNHDFNPDWYGRLEYGTSSAGTFWADKHYGTAISRKWLPERSLVTTFGFAYNDNRQDYSDRIYTLGLVYYFDGPWVVEGGVHRNLSNPGSVTSTQGYAAITYGRDHWRQIVLAINSGSEGYLPTGGNTPQQVFDSQYYSLGWKEWLGRHWGVHATLDYYRSPYYQRGGASTAVFWDLP